MPRALVRPLSIPVNSFLMKILFNIPDFILGLYLILVLSDTKTYSAYSNIYPRDSTLYATIDDSTIPQNPVMPQGQDGFQGQDHGEVKEGFRSSIHDTVPVNRPFVGILVDKDDYEKPVVGIDGYERPVQGHEGVNEGFRSSLHDTVPVNGLFVGTFVDDYEKPVVEIDGGYTGHHDNPPPYEMLPRNQPLAPAYDKPPYKGLNQM